MHVSRQPNSGYKALTFFFTFERLGDCCGLIKACCGLIKAFGEGWLRQRMGLNERTIRWRRSRQRAWVRDRPWLCVRWERECESVRGCARDGCARERVRVRQYRVICEALKFEFSLFKTRVSETRFYFSKPSLRHTRSTCAESTWRVHVDCAHIRKGNRASEARFWAWKSSLWGSSC